MTETVKLFYPKHLVEGTNIESLRAIYAEWLAAAKQLLDAKSEAPGASILQYAGAVVKAVNLLWVSEIETLRRGRNHTCDEVASQLQQAWKVKTLLVANRARFSSVPSDVPSDFERIAFELCELGFIDSKREGGDLTLGRVCTLSNELNRRYWKLGGYSAGLSVDRISGRIIRNDSPNSIYAGFGNHDPGCLGDYVVTVMQEAHAFDDRILSQVNRRAGYLRDKYQGGPG